MTIYKRCAHCGEYKEPTFFISVPNSDDGLSHICIRCSIIKAAENYARNHHESQEYEKPWKDPESLFCDTKFLQGFLQKEVTPKEYLNHNTRYKPLPLDKVLPLLNDGMSASNISKKLDIPHTTLCMKLKEIGYIFNRRCKKWELQTGAL